MGKRLFALLTALILLSIIVLSGCAPRSRETGGQSGRPLRVGVLLLGMLGDRGYNDVLKAGTDRAIADFGIEVRIFEASGPADYEGNLMAAISENFDLIICQGSTWASLMRAEDYPQIKFAITDFIINPAPPNLTSVAFAPNEGQFLVGAAMAMLSSRVEIPGITGVKRVGWITGLESPNINDFWVGFEQGVRYIDPEIQILRAFAGSWSDPIRGKELALAQYDQGVSIIAQVASRTGLGIIEAAAERGRFVVGVDANQDGLAPGHVMTSMLKNLDVGVYSVIESVINNDFQGGGYLYMDLSNGGIGLTDFAVFREHLGPLFPQDIIDTIDELTKKVASGEIKVNTFPGIRPWES